MLAKFLTLTSWFTMIFYCESVLAKDVYVGKTSSGAPCALSLNAEQDNISFNSNGSGFGFFASVEEVTDMVNRGHQKVLLEGEDGRLLASLTMTFNKQKQLTSAFYSQKSFLKHKRIQCLQLAKR